MSMLEVKDLEVYYGVIQAIKGISFHVEEGAVSYTHLVHEKVRGYWKPNISNIRSILSHKDRQLLQDCKRHEILWAVHG